nr:MAG TPA: hypothetical protein [Caudoviricetes sp.]
MRNFPGMRMKQALKTRFKAREIRFVYKCSRFENSRVLKVLLSI